MTAYATRLANHLAESRRNGLPFERAYKLAEADLTPEEDYPMAALIRVWEAAYNRRGRGQGATASLLSDRDRLYVGHEYVSPEFTGERRCGWGGDQTCPEAGAPYLCASHAQMIRAAFARAKYRHPAEDHMEQTAAIREREAA